MLCSIFNSSGKYIGPYSNTPSNIIETKHSYTLALTDRHGGRHLGSVIKQLSNGIKLCHESQYGIILTNENNQNIDQLISTWCKSLLQ